ncbi:MAG: adenylate/guanylate cyclase domain-containing protein, partial [Candidatus Binatia bacterium]
MEITAEIVTAFVAAGMGAAFIAADYRSRTSWILGLFFVLLGASITANVCAVRAYRAGAPHSWPAFAALADTAVLLVAHEWILRIRRTIPARGLRTSFGDRMLRVAQVLALVYGGLALALPDLRVREFLGVMREAGPGASLGFWVFFLPFGLSVLGGIASIVLVLNRKPDPAEKVRLVALSAAAPPLAAGALLPDE